MTVYFLVTTSFSNLRFPYYILDQAHNGDQEKTQPKVWTSQDHTGLQINRNKEHLNENLLVCQYWIPSEAFSLLPSTKTWRHQKNHGCSHMNLELLNQQNKLAYKPKYSIKKLNLIKCKQTIKYFDQTGFISGMQGRFNTLLPGSTTLFNCQTFCVRQLSHYILLGELTLLSA